ncbi:sensor histidine kinase [Gordonia zhaorongruii]|uniref:sensor histidine kinase n=1 Tax=Gordonia zhaorongruii TaxID=2597659 RepID=UPI001048A6EA|nr:HAMP domain-containing sensor histidine kinase [Gordonia zhaorongruii]
MRRRILRMMIATLVAVGVLLGVPLTVLSWQWMSQDAQQSLAKSLKRMSEFVIAEESEGRPVDPTALDLEQFRLLVPAGGRLMLDARVPTESGTVRTLHRQIGSEVDSSMISESVSLGTDAELTLEVPYESVRPQQWAAAGVLLVVIVASVGGGAVVAVVTARRLTEPLTDVAERAAGMARGDFSAPWPRYGIAELDEVAATLADANREIALRLEREGEIVGDVSHQLRSRLTAVHLRLDELTLHDDPAVVSEAEAGLEQVDRLTSELDELVAASREDSSGRGVVDAGQVIDTLIGDFDPAFTAVGRVLRTDRVPSTRLIAGKPGRLREALSVLIDNSLQHGDGTTTVRITDLPAAEMVRVTVADDGPGIADDIALDVFRRGFSGGSRSGVGLSLSRALIEADGGRLDLTSRRPAVFSIVLPVAGEHRSEDDQMGEDSHPPGQTFTRGRVPHR